MSGDSMVYRLKAYDIREYILENIDDLKDEVCSLWEDDPGDYIDDLKDFTNDLLNEMNLRTYDDCNPFIVGYISLSCPDAEDIADILKDRYKHNELAVKGIDKVVNDEFIWYNHLSYEQELIAEDLANYVGEDVCYVGGGDYIGPQLAPIEILALDKSMVRKEIERATDDIELLSKIARKFDWKDGCCETEGIGIALSEELNCELCFTIDEHWKKSLKKFSEALESTMEHYENDENWVEIIDRGEAEWVWEAE